MTETSLKQLSLANYLIPMLEEHLRSGSEGDRAETLIVLLDAILMKSLAEKALQSNTFKGSRSDSDGGCMPFAFEMQVSK